MLGLLLAALTGLAAGAPAAGAQDAEVRPDVAELTTRAEATAYRETTTYDETLAFLRALDGRVSAGGTRFELTSFGTSAEGRVLPLMIVTGGNEAPALRVWLQGSIHGGEVCGTEALLTLLRDLAGDRAPSWTERLTLLVAPIYNADGHAAMALDNRPRQHGPVGGMGKRRNAQDLDLNRDHMKLETPEARALVTALGPDGHAPDVVIDLHTTNGTRHGYHLTYAPPLHPNTPPPIDTVLRNEWLPAVTDAIQERHGWATYHYGNLIPATGPDRAWRTFDHRPRFNNNYVGLRHRFALISEAYSYATFEERVRVTRTFVDASLDFAAAHADRLRTIVSAADATSVVGTSLALRARGRRTVDPPSILLGDTVEEPHPETGAPMLRRTDVVREVDLPETIAFQGSLFDRTPNAYYVPADLTQVRAHLQRHGIRTDELTEAAEVEVEEFVITSSTQSDRPFEAHLERRVDGRWRPARRRLPAGTVVVEVDQPLGRLAFSLLEPQSDDGMVNWNQLDDALEGAETYPILRAR